VLRHTGLVTATSSGKNVWYQTRHAALASLSEWLDFVAKRAADARRPPPGGRDDQPGDLRRVQHPDLLAASRFFAAVFGSASASLSP